MARPISDEELQLKRRARRRLIGAIVLVTAIVVALPMVLDTEPKPLSGEVSIKIPSPDSSTFASRVVPVAPPGDAKPGTAPKLATETKSASKSPAAPAEKAAVATAPAAASSAMAPAPERPAKAPQSETPAKSVASASKKPPPQKPASAPFVVQVVALADVEKAKHVQAQIAAAGIKAYTEVVKTAKGDVTRVRAGPFPTRAAAEKARDQLNAIGLPGNIASK
jgi:DedD protein